MDKRKRRLLCMLEGSGRKSRWISGVPPLSFRAKKAGTLENYRIFGDTVGGESVGDRTGNLWDGEFLQGYWAGANGQFVNANNWICTKKIPCKSNTDYTFKFTNISRWYSFSWYDTNDNYIGQQDSTTATTPTTFTRTSPANAAYLAIDIAGYPDYSGKISPSDVTDLMLVEGSTPLPYEPYGYKVPVTVEGKNLLPNTATSRTVNGVTFTVNDDGSVTCNGKANANTWFDINRSFDVYAPDGRIVSIGNQGSLNTFYLNIGYVGGIVFSSYEYSTDTHNIAWVHIVIASGYTCDNLTLYPMIRKADITDDKYEPYHAPVTTPIYLPEQIHKVGDEAEYIDYAEQKMHRIGADDIDVTLPALPTLTGTNVLSVGTVVQPSEIEIKGKIKAL